MREAKGQVADNFGIDSTRLRVLDEKTGEEMKDTVTMRMARLQDDDSLGVVAKVPFIDLPDGRPVNLRGLRDTQTTDALAAKIAESERPVDIHGYFTLRAETARMSWQGQAIDTTRGHSLAEYGIRKDWSN